LQGAFLNAGRASAATIVLVFSTHCTSTVKRRASQGVNHPKSISMYSHEETNVLTLWLFLLPFLMSFQYAKSSRRRSFLPASVALYCTWYQLATFSSTITAIFRPLRPPPPNSRPIHQTGKAFHRQKRVINLKNSVEQRSKL
jgi:hypothetical protein